MKNEVLENKDRRIARKIKKLLDEARQTLKEDRDCKEVDVANAKYNYYLEGLKDAYGLDKIRELVDLSFTLDEGKTPRFKFEGGYTK